MTTTTTPDWAEPFRSPVIPRVMVIKRPPRFITTLRFNSTLTGRTARWSPGRFCALPEGAPWCVRNQPPGPPACQDDPVEDAVVVRAADAARLLSEATGTDYEVVGRLHGGESGAYEFRGPQGRPFVVKWDAHPVSRQLRGEAVVLSERLRTQAAWPVPAQSVLDVNDVRFVIQEFMPGVPCEQLDHRLVDQVLDLHERRLGLARPGDPVHWPTDLIATLTVGGEGYCLHSSLRDFDRRTRSLVERIEAFGYSIDPEELRPRGRDIVHWDLHAGNLLVGNGSLAAVIDTDFAVVGDAQFDLVTLAVSSVALPCARGVRARLFAAGAADLDDRPTQAYLAHLILRVIDWPIRRGRLDEVERWLREARELLTF